MVDILKTLYRYPPQRLHRTDTTKKTLTHFKQVGCALRLS